MKFLGRKTHINYLQNEYDNEMTNFVVLYGRRRIGKTRLLREFIKDKRTLFFTASEQIEGENIKAFMTELALFSNTKHLQKLNVSSWNIAFDLLLENLPKEKIVIVIDEFQDLITVNPAFASIFRNIWDLQLKKHNIMLIISGSHMSMMINEVLNYSSPLYGRRTGQIKLGPLSFNEMNELFHDKSFSEQVFIYSVTGGVPLYIELFANNLSFDDNLRNNIFSPRGLLFDEPIFLLEKMFREKSKYLSILKTIANGNRKISKITSSLAVQKGDISPYIRNLIDLFIIERRVPITETSPEKSRKGLYYISDNYMSFWLKFVFPYKNQLNQELLNIVEKRISTHFIDSHVSSIFEDICRNHVLVNEDSYGLSISMIGQYWDKDIELDLVAIDETNKTVLFGECKFTNRPIDKRVLENLEKKSNQLTRFSNYKIYYCLFSKSGFSNGLEKLSIEREDLLLSNELLI